MKAVYQRVTSASVSIDGNTVGSIDSGVMLLLGIADGDTEHQADVLAKKVAGLRVFSDADGRFSDSVLDVGGGVLVVSQFTLCANCSHGRRPDFFAAARPEVARPLVEYFIDRLRAEGVTRVESGEFGADMQVSLVNDGPVTILLDTADWK